jgi:hypothetical protein
VHIYRWDLDKTYLQTDFDSFRGLVRTAMEPASAKVAVPGAAALLRALSRDERSRVYIVSGSPTQMRGVLEEKLRLDGVRFESLTLKDNLDNLRKGRFRAIKGQFGYKLPELLKGREGMGKAVRETLFGDDAEVDALVYSVYADAVSGRLSATELERIMVAAGAYPDRIDLALRSLGRIATADAVERIFIRLERKVPSGRFDTLGRRLVPVHSWWQAGLCMAQDGRLAMGQLGEVMAAVLREERLDAWAMAALSQDIVRRGHVSADFLQQIEGPVDVVTACQAAVAGLEVLSATDGPVQVPDYLALLR